MVGRRIACAAEAPKFIGYNAICAKRESALDTHAAEKQGTTAKAKKTTPFECLSDWVARPSWVGAGFLRDRPRLSPGPQRRSASGRRFAHHPSGIAIDRRPLSHLVRRACDLPIL